MKISHIEHIGIAVPNLEEAIKYYENVLGLKCYKQEVVADQKVTTAFFQLGDTKIELLEATSPDSTIAKFIEKNGGKGGMHHLAFAVEDGVTNALAECEEKGIRTIDKAPRAGADACRSHSSTPNALRPCSQSSARTLTNNPNPITSGIETRLRPNAAL